MSQHASNNYILRRRLRSLLSPTTALTLCAPGIALAGPIGEDVIRGHADVTRPDANNTIIKQYTDKAVINWQSFNVDADEYVIFNQLDASSIVLNRVLGGDTSYILGHIQANGQVFLLNPNGVFFTHGASLDVQGFLASTLDMNPDSFMNGNFTLTRSPDAPATASIINDGNITAGPGGYVVLAGDYTENTGIITANAGTVALVSGNALTLDIQGDGLVSFTVDEATLSEAAGVRNAGSLIADGGRVIMTAKVASNLVATAVNNEGLVRAHSVEQRNGEIYLVGNGGDVVNSGTLDANGENADGGGIALYSDRDVTLADGGVQTATGDENHSGGVIRAIAEEHLDYQKDNVIRVTGGVNGGFVEVSGHGSLALRGIPEIGAGGTFLIDPQNIHIQNNSDGPTFNSGGTSGSITSIGAGYLETQLGLGVDVLLVATNSIRYTGASSASINVTGNNADLTIAIGTINSTGGANDPGIGTPWAGNVFLDGTPTYTDWTSGSIDIANLDINIGGNITLDANQGTIQFNRLVTSNGNITINAGDGSGSIVGGSGGIDAAGNVTIGTLPSLPSYGGDVTLNGAIDAGGDIAIAGNHVTTNSLRGNNINLAIGGSSARLSVAGDVNADGNASFINNSINMGGSADIAVTGNVSAGGAVTMDGTRITVNDINASSVDVSIKGSNASFTANGVITANNNVKIGQFGQGVANIAVNGIQASRIWMYADGFIETGDLNALGSLATPGYDQRGIINLDAINGIDTGRLNAINDLSGASINLFTSSGNITVNGDVTATGAKAPGFADTVVEMYASNGGISIDGNLEASGYGGPGDSGLLPGADVYLSTGGAGGINVNGGVTVTGHAGSYSNGTQSGVTGGAIFYAWANGVGNLDIGGPVNVTGVGYVEADLYGRNVTAGDITVLANPGSFTVSESDPSGDGSDITAAASGMATINIDTGISSGVGTINVGNLSATGPDAMIHLIDAVSITAEAIDVHATGKDIDTTFTTSYGGAVVGHESVDGGMASLFVGLKDGSASTVAIDINGAIDVTARGQALVDLQGTTIETRGVSVTATAGNYSRSGEIPAGPGGSDFKEWPYDGEFGGPKIDTGTVTGGAATFRVGGVHTGTGTSSGAPPAEDVSIDGSIAVNGAGTARIEIYGGDIAVSGNIEATATHAQQDGMVDETHDDNGDTVHIESTVSASFGDAGFDITGDTIDLANVSVKGPSAHGRIEGVNITVGAVNLDASGGSVVVDETETVNGGTPLPFEFNGPGLLAGLVLFADNTLELTGDLTLNAVGAGGAILRGASISTQDITLDVTDGNYSVLSPQAFGNTTKNFTLGNAILGIVGATADVNGNVTMTASQAAHFGGAVDASGNFSITAGTDIDNIVPDTVQFLNRLENEDEDSSIVLPPAFDVQAVNIRLAAGGDAVVAGNLTADALAVTAGDRVDLSDADIKVGSGRFNDIAGDTTFLSLLALEGLTAPDGGPNLLVQGQDVTLGDFELAGDYLFIKAGTLAFSGTVTSGNPNLLVQLAPLNAGAAMHLTQSGTPGYSNTGHLGLFDGTTFALGTTANTGDMTIAADGATIDIGASNLFVLTTGTVTGLDNVLSTGVVKDLATLIGGEFEVPQTDEIDTSQNLVQSLRDDYELDDGEDDEGDEEGEDTDTDTGTDGDEDELISRDTVDEEMMCQ
ncbi:MAG TPA: filamentous hemagglutinin N-terminal domain-containing protein [Gammaproteobacteria bacterium]